MKIKEVEVFGFKSFVDKTVFSIQPRITAIVGPNGCGKSNVVDAIRWAMGEHSAKQLRGALMEDVIFNGSERRKPIGVAEVSLIFSNEDGVAPPTCKEFSEIQITRRFFRSGDSEYYINKTPCRLKDISELFMDTGVGSKNYSVIEQGKVDSILNAKPQDRRFLIEEAAGITKYKSRKKEALSKIDSTKRNMVRLSDIIGEIKRQMNSLNRQAKKAKRYNSIKGEIRDIELKMASNEYEGLLNKKQEMENLINTLRVKETESFARIQSNENRLEKMKIMLLDKENELKSIQERFFSVNNSILRNKDRIEYGSKDLQNFEKQSVSLKEDITKFNSQLKATKEEIRTLDQRQVDFYSTLTDLELKLREVELRFNREEQFYETTIKSVETLKADLIDILTESTHLKNSIAHLRDQHENFSRRENRNKKEIGAIKEAIHSLELRENRLEKEYEEQRAVKQELEDEKEKRLNHVNRLKVTLEDKGKAMEGLKERMGENTARLNSLKELQRNLEGYQEGVRSILLKHDAEDQKNGGIFGVVADIVETESKYETALEAILGERLQYIIVKSQYEGVEAIAFLKSQSAGRSSFIPMIPIKEKQTHNDTSFTDNKFVELIDVVKVKDGFTDIAKYLLANVHIVEDLTKAIEFWNKNGYIGDLVTLDGDIIDSHGVLTGGSKDYVTGGILQKNREIKELEHKTEQITREYNTIKDEHILVLEDISSLQGEIERLNQELHTTEVKTITLENDLSQVQKELNRHKEKAGILNFDRDQLRVDSEKSERYLLEKTKELKRLSQVRNEKEERVGKLQREEKEAKKEIDGLRADITDSKVRISSLKEKLKGISFNQNRLRNIKEELIKETKKKETERQENVCKMHNISEMIGDSKVALEGLLDLYKDLEDFLSRKKMETNIVLEQIRKEEDRNKDLTRDLEVINRRLSELNLNITEIDLTITNLKQRIKEKYYIGLDKTLDLSTCGWNEGEMKERLENLRESMERMGEVNLMAISDYEELTQRFEFLIAQKDDLSQSLEYLQKTIKRINRVTKKSFNETFLAINEKFKETFSCLFKGGEAELILTDEDDFLETGIEIIAQPPGKRLQSLNLLSGGEKTLATIALIFSIFTIKPSPFCILDEVDAALDDPNIERFNKLLIDMSDNSQFVIVTHNKRTMEIANALVGVTMEESGVSKLVSVKMN
ncbi:MAG: chromosome segregation protein SMC [Thermodesulfobacteriota bacterium]|nr:chromosome segregation protein SMC [Thermodesulfobacteriota bacterium]